MAHRLHHSTPLHISSENSIFYVTQCALPRGRDNLLFHASALVNAICFYHNEGLWNCHAYVVMPDHLHLLATPAAPHSITTLMKQWKSYTAREYAITWQRDFFECRLRDEEAPSEKAQYMELNP